MARNFRDYTEAISPTWMSLPNGYGVRFMRGFIGYAADLYMEAATQAVKVSWIRADVPDDALYWIGENFDIQQVPGETNAEFRDRLTDEPGAWTLWEESGTGDFADNVFQPFGVAAASCDLYTRNEWTKMPFPDFWSQFWIVLSPPLPWDEATYGGAVWGTWGTSGTWGSSATHEQIAGVLDLVLKWKSGHETGNEIILDYHNHLYGTPPTWGATRTWGGNGVVRWNMTRRIGKGKAWGDKETYRPTLDRVWGGKIQF